MAEREEAVMSPVRWAVAVAIGITLIAGCGSGGDRTGAPAGTSPEPAADPTPIDSGHLVIAVGGRVVEIGADGTRRRVLSDLPEGSRVESLDLHPRRDSVILGVRGSTPEGASSNCEARLIHLSTEGVSRVIAEQGTFPAISADGRMLAYAVIDRRGDICYRTEIAVRDLETGMTRAFPLEEPIADSGAHDGLISWSPDGRVIAVVGDNGGGAASGFGVVLLSVDEGSREALPGYWSAPAFAEDGHLLIQEGCCVGGVALVSTAVPTEAMDGDLVPEYELPAPVVSLHAGEDPRSIVAVTALGDLWVGDAGRLRRLRPEGAGVAAADR